MNKKVQYKGQFRVYIMWPLYAAILLLILDIVLFTQNITCGIVGVAFTLVYGVCALIFLLRKQPLLTKAMVEFAADYAQVQKTLLEDFKVPYGLIDESGKVIWLNHEFKNVLQEIAADMPAIFCIFPCGVHPLRSVSPVDLGSGYHADRVALPESQEDFL